MKETELNMRPLSALEKSFRMDGLKIARFLEQSKDVDTKVDFLKNLYDAMEVNPKAYAEGYDSALMHTLIDFIYDKQPVLEHVALKVLTKIISLQSDVFHSVSNLNNIISAADYARYLRYAPLTTVDATLAGAVIKANPEASDKALEVLYTMAREGHDAAAREFENVLQNPQIREQYPEIGGRAWEMVKDLTRINYFSASRTPSSKMILVLANHASEYEMHHRLGPLIERLNTSGNMELRTTAYEAMDILINRAAESSYFNIDRFVHPIEMGCQDEEHAIRCRALKAFQSYSVVAPDKALRYMSHLLKAEAGVKPIPRGPAPV